MTDLNRRIKRRSIHPHRDRRIVISLEPGDLIGLPQRNEASMSLEGQVI